MQIIVLIVIILCSMVLHELAHGVVAYWLGDTTAKEEGRLTLNPLAHIEPITSVILPLMLYLMGAPIIGGAKPVPINTRNLKGGAWGMALVGVAGPLTNMIIALVVFLIGHFTGLLYGSGMGYFIVAQTVLTNLGFAVFNMLPIPPLDGSRVLYAIAPDGVRNVMDRLEQGAGVFLVFGLVMLFGAGLSQFTGAVINQILQFFYFLVGN